MNAASRELLRQCILVQLSQAAPFFVPLATLKVFVLIGGFKGITDQELAAELDYLAEKKLVAADGKVVSPENTRWKVTAEGRDFLAKEGLA